MYFSWRCLGVKKKYTYTAYVVSLQAWLASIFIRYLICIVDLAGKEHVEERVEIGS